MVKRLAAHINEDKACSACYAALVYALHHAKAPKTKINIGQGFISNPGEVGCGNCTKEHERFVNGCPPTAADVLEFLRKGE
jgi:predicted PhzF superfamily epimerase YddE/YHI9